jgi:rhamnogalacturonan acetylesterase
VAAQTSVGYVDHTKYAVNRWQALGPTTAKTYYPNDNTHTNPAGAQSKSVPERVRKNEANLVSVNTEAFVTALKCAKSPLGAYLNSNSTSINYTC